MFTPKASQNQAMNGVGVTANFPELYLVLVSCHPLTQHSNLGRRSLQNYKPNASEQSNAAADLPLGDTFLLHPVTHGYPQIQLCIIMFISFIFITFPVQRAFSYHPLFGRCSARSARNGS